MPGVVFNTRLISTLFASCKPGASFPEKGTEMLKERVTGAVCCLNYQNLADVDGCCFLL